MSIEGTSNAMGVDMAMLLSSEVLHPFCRLVPLVRKGHTALN